MIEGILSNMKDKGKEGSCFMHHTKCFLHLNFFQNINNVLIILYIK